MVLFVSLFFSLVVFGELNWVQCEPTNFAPPNDGIFHFAALHSSSIQPYFADYRTIDPSELDAGNATKIWMFVRHGSRTAKTKETNVFKSMENGLRVEILNNLCNSHYECPLSEDNWIRLNNWKWNTTFDPDRVLTEAGKAELKLIAMNYKTRFPHLFQAPFNTNRFNVMATNTPRTKDSAMEFFNEAIGENGCNNVLVVANDEQEGIIKAYKEENYRQKNKDMERSKTSLVNKFYKTDAFRQVVQNVNQRLLFEDVDNKDRVMNMYDLCRYEGTWTPYWTPGGESVWCSMFNANELLVLEYAKDLNSFSETGPSCDLNKIVQCPSVRDMMEQLSRSRGPKVTAYFTHSPAILLHLTAMGAYAQGEPIKAKYNKRTQYREWNTSTLSPMAANFVAVLYKNNKVKFFLNDKVVYLPFDDCPNGLCDVIFLRSLYGHCM